MRQNTSTWWKNYLWWPTTSLAIICLSAAPTSAQQIENDGGLQASVGLNFDFNDNIFDNNEVKVESWIARLSPGLSLSSAPGKRQYTIAYEGDYGKYFDSSDDDYDDHSISASGQLQTGVRGQLDLAAGFERGHNGRGAGQTQGVPPDSPEFPDEIDIFDSVSWSSEYTHGADEARGRLTFGLGQVAREYTTNRDRTQTLDRTDSNAVVGLSIGTGRRTAYILELDYTNIDYEFDRLGQSSLSGDDWRALVGITWEATSRTEGSVRVGAQRREFDEPGREASSSASWDVAIRWSPRDYSYFDIATSRENDETIDQSGQSNFIDRTGYALSWTHEWSAGMESVLRFNTRDEDFVGTVRKQDESEAYLGVRIPRRSRLSWEAGIGWRDRSGTIPDLEYEGLLFTIGVNLLLVR